MASKRELERRIKHLEDQLSKRIINADERWGYASVSIGGRVEAIEKHIGIQTYVKQPTGAAVQTDVLKKTKDPTKAKAKKGKK